MFWISYKKQFEIYLNFGKKTTRGPCELVMFCNFLKTAVCMCHIHGVFEKSVGIDDALLVSTQLHWKLDFLLLPT